MDTTTGTIYTPEEMEAIDKAFRKDQEEVTRQAFEFMKRFGKPMPKKKNLKEMKVPPTSTQIKTQKVGRSDKCPCGSDKKFKKCCLNK